MRVEAVGFIVSLTRYTLCLAAAVRKNRYVILPGDFDEAWKVSRRVRFVILSLPTPPMTRAKRKRDPCVDSSQARKPSQSRPRLEYLYPRPLSSCSKLSRRVTILTSFVRSLSALCISLQGYAFAWIVRLTGYRCVAARSTLDRPIDVAFINALGDRFIVRHLRRIGHRSSAS